MLDPGAADLIADLPRLLATLPADERVVSINIQTGGSHRVAGTVDPSSWHMEWRAGVVEAQVVTERARGVHRGRAGDFDLLDRDNPEPVPLPVLERTYWRAYVDRSTGARSRSLGMVSRQLHAGNL